MLRRSHCRQVEALAQHGGRGTLRLTPPVSSSFDFLSLGNLYFSVDPTRGVGTVLMSQSLPFWDDKVLQVWDAAERAVYDSLV